MKLKNKKFLIPITILGITLILCLLYFTSPFSPVGTSYSSYEKTIEEKIKDITATNENLSTIQSEKHIDTETATKELPTIISSLSKKAKSIVKITPSKKYTKEHNFLIKGINNNVLLYKQMLLILKNPNSKDLNDSIKNIKKYKTDTITNYNKVKIKDLTISLSPKCIKVIDNFIYYSEELIKINTQTELLKNQNKDFINKMDGILDSFNSIKDDFSNYLTNAKKNSKSYNNILTKVDKTLLSLDNLMIKFGDISVPEKADDLTQQFNKTIISYTTYLQNFKNSIKDEKIKSSEDNPTIENLDKFNTNKNSDFNTTNTTFSTFKHSFNTYKKSI